MPPQLSQKPAATISPESDEPTETFRDLVVFDRSGKLISKGDRGGAEFYDSQRPLPSGAVAYPRIAIPRENGAALRALRALEESRDGRQREAFAASWVQALLEDPVRLKALISSLPGIVDPELRRIALIVLGRVAHPEAVQGLLDVAQHERDRDSRIMAIRSLFQNGRGVAPEAFAGLPQFRPLVETAVSEDRVTPLLDLARRERDPAIFDALVGNLARFQQDARITQGSDSRYEEINRALAALLRDESDPQRTQALLLGMVSAQNPVTRDAVLDKLRNSQEPGVLGLALRALGNQAETSQTLDVKMSLATGSIHESVRQKAMESMTAGLGESMNRPWLAERLGPSVINDPSPRARIAGTQTLALCGDAGKQYLEKLAGSDQDPQVRKTARECLEARKK